MLTSEIVKQYGLDTGAKIVGIAAASDFASAPEGFRPSDILDGCRSVVVLGDAFPKEALSLPAPEYTAMRNAILTRMTDMAKKVAKRIKADKHQIKAISASGGKTIEGQHWGHISLKHAAELAGLGRINRNYLLTNDQYGNLLWFSAFLTDADLVPDEKAQYIVCDNCEKCVAACPSGALDDPACFGKKECAKHFKIVNKKLEIQCFMCRRVCPYRFGVSDQ